MQVLLLWKYMESFKGGMPVHRCNVIGVFADTDEGRELAEKKQEEEPDMKGWDVNFELKEMEVQGWSLSL